MAAQLCFITTPDAQNLKVENLDHLIRLICRYDGNMLIFFKASVLYATKILSTEKGVWNVSQLGANIHSFTTAELISYLTELDIKV